jgi:hypothetical protein
MHPRSITYRSEKYSLVHLAQSIGLFDWKSKDGRKIAFSVRVRYSNHCYSKSLILGEQPAVDDVVVNCDPLRVFCTERHSYSTGLVMIVKGLFAKPTTTVHLTHESNWHIYQLYTSTDGGHDRYCVFFRVKKSDVDKLASGAYPLDLFVESAYLRGEMVKPLKRVPFGKVAEMTMLGLEYF